MRLLTMLATAVLLAACVHDTDDFTLFVAESGASLTYYIGSDEEGRQKGHDDPWDTILDSFGKDTSHRGKKNRGNDNEPDDPWDTIQEKFFMETNHTGTGTKNGEPDDPWDTIAEKFGVESVHRGKTSSRHFRGFEKSVVVFVSFDYEVSSADRARVAEVRGNVLKLEFTDGVVQYVIDAPATWTEGTHLVTRFLGATSKKDHSFLGVWFWRTVKEGDWGREGG